MIPELKATQRRGGVIPALSDLLEHLGRTLHPIVVLADLPAEERNRFERNELCLHRTTIDLIYFIAAEISAGGYTAVNTWLHSLFSMDVAVALRAAQLLLERTEDDTVQIGARLERVRLASGGPFNTEFPLIGELSGVSSAEAVCGLVAKHGLQLLLEIAAAKRMLANSASLIMQHINGTHEAATASFPAVAVLNAEDAQLYFLTQLVHQGGKMGLISYLRRDALPCLPSMARAIDRSKPAIKSFDPFAALAGKDVYTEACKAVTQVVYAKNVKALVDWANAGDNKRRAWPEKANILLAAVTTQVVGNNLPVDEGVQFMIVEWLNLGFPTPDMNAKLATDLCRLLLAYRGKDRQSVAQLDTMRLYLQIHVTLVAMNPASGWMHALLADPASLQKKLIPSMADSELAQLLMAASLDRDVGVYQCPNGHVYTIGNCTRPWVLGVCKEVGCGATIGGEGHREAAGNKMLGTAHSMIAEVTNPGYMFDVCSSGETGYEIPRLGRLTTTVLRFVIHSIMGMSAELYPLQQGKCSNGGKSAVAQLMHPEAAMSSLRPERIAKEIGDNLQRDWNQLRVMLQVRVM